MKAGRRLARPERAGRGAARGAAWARTGHAQEAAAATRPVRDAEWRGGAGAQVAVAAAPAGAGRGVRLAARREESIVVRLAGARGATERRAGTAGAARRERLGRAGRSRGRASRGELGGACRSRGAAYPARAASRQAERRRGTEPWAHPAGRAESRRGVGSRAGGKRQRGRSGAAVGRSPRARPQAARRTRELGGRRRREGTGAEVGKAGDARSMVQRTPLSGTYMACV